MLLGEQAVPLVRSVFASPEVGQTIRSSCVEHVFGRLPTNSQGAERSD